MTTQPRVGEVYEREGRTRKVVGVKSGNTGPKGGHLWITWLNSGRVRCKCTLTEWNDWARLATLVGREAVV